jgi:ABC-type cobalamin/Fe3+-siderophores transport system ATPase subunit
MQKLTIKNFGPISQCELELSDFTILIGPQASGKSTTSKLIFFFLNIRDEFVNFILDKIDNPSENIPEKNIEREFGKIIRNRFLEFWGPAPQHSEMYLKFSYSADAYIEIKLDSAKHKYIDPSFSKLILNKLRSATAEISSANNNESPSSHLFGSAQSISSERARGARVEKVIEMANDIFAFKYKLLFIPAGRSLLSTLSDQLQYIHPHQLDYPMRVFIERINKSKSFFGKSISELITDRQLLGNGDIWFSAARKVEGIVKRILKGEFIHDKDGGKLYVNKSTYSKINFASSGQQESIWILLSLFLVVLEKIDALMFIEEPEAHLFPNAQKDMVELIAFLANSMDTKFVITTHSPYVLAALNNHIYAAKIGETKPEAVTKVISKNSWLNFDNVSGYFIANGVLEDLRDDSLGVLKPELIDSASGLINEQYDQLFCIDTEEINNA